MGWVRRLFFNCKLVYLRIRYMTCLNKVLEILKSNAINRITEAEKNLILLNCNAGVDTHTIAFLITRIRYRATLIQRLAALGIPESSLSEEEIDWIAAILNNTKVSIDDAVDEIRTANSRNRKLQNAATMS